MRKVRVGKMVEAAGVELYNPLILRKLLVFKEARRAQNTTLPDRRYKNGTNFADVVLLDEVRLAIPGTATTAKKVPLREPLYV
jgi:hypothetical protein